MRHRQPLTSRACFRLSLGALAAYFFASALSVASAQAGFPNHPLKIVVGFPAGGASDVAARAIGQKIAERLGQPVVIENRPGAASNIGSEFVARAPGDGYTLLFGTISLSINPSLYPKLTYDPLRDLAPVSMISSAPFLLVVNPSSPIRSVRELIAAAKTSDLTYATAGNGSGSHLFMELFRSEANIKLTHVPYRGAAPAMNDVLGGQVPLTFDNIITTLPLVQAGKLRALAVSTRTRSKVAPEIPTMDESGVPGFDATSWFGLFVPASTPREIVTRLNEETIEALKDAGVRDKLLKLGAEPIGSSADEFGRFFRGEVARWGKVVRDAKVQID